MSASRWRHGGYYFPPAPSAPPDPRFHGYPNYQNYHSYNNASYFHATPPRQNHMHLIPLQHPNDGFYSPRNNLYGTSQDYHWTGQVQHLTPYPVQHVHHAISQTHHESFPRFPNRMHTPFVGRTSYSKASKLNPEVQVRQNPSSTSKKVEPSELKQAPDNTVHAEATPIAVNPPAKKSIQWPKPDIELVVKDLSNPINDSFSRKRKRKRNNKKNKKEKVKKEPPHELMHYYKKHMVRDPWYNLKPVVGNIVKKLAVDNVIANKGKCEGVVKINYSKMSLADCLDITFEETVNGTVLL